MNAINHMGHHIQGSRVPIWGFEDRLDFAYKCFCVAEELRRELNVVLSALY